MLDSAADQRGDRGTTGETIPELAPTDGDSPALFETALRWERELEVTATKAASRLVRSQQERFGVELERRRLAALEALHAVSTASALTTQVRLQLLAAVMPSLRVDLLAVSSQRGSFHQPSWAFVRANEAEARELLASIVERLRRRGEVSWLVARFERAGRFLLEAPIIVEPRLAELQAFLVTTGLRALEKEAGLS